MISSWSTKSCARYSKREKGSNVALPRCYIPIAIGESLKNLDKLTNGELLARYPDVDWKGAKGARDIISHHYFDLNAEAVFGICRKDIPNLTAVVEKIITDVSHG
jgi:uncharacterized protein with HEPN domain